MRNKRRSDGRRFGRETVATTNGSLHCRILPRNKSERLRQPDWFHTPEEVFWRIEPPPLDPSSEYVRVASVVKSTDPGSDYLRVALPTSSISDTASPSGVGDRIGMISLIHCGTLDTTRARTHALKKTSPSDTGCTTSLLATSRPPSWDPKVPSPQCEQQFATPACRGDRNLSLSAPGSRAFAVRVANPLQTLGHNDPLEIDCSLDKAWHTLSERSYPSGPPQS